MSIINFYAIYDRKAMLYNSPFQADNAAVAERMVLDFAISSPHHPLVMHREDYEVFSIGHFDSVQGCFIPFERPQFEFSVDAVISAYRLQALERNGGAAVGGETPLKPQSDPASDSTLERLEDTFSNDSTN